MALKIYSNEHGTNITWEKDKDTHWSWHSNSNSNDRPLFSVKTEDGQYVRKYDEDARRSSEELKDAKEKESSSSWDDFDFDDDD